MASSRSLDGFFGTGGEGGCFTPGSYGRVTPICGVSADASFVSAWVKKEITWIWLPPSVPVTVSHCPDGRWEVLEAMARPVPEATVDGETVRMPSKAYWAAEVDRLRAELGLAGTAIVRHVGEPEARGEDFFAALGLGERQAIWARVLLANHRGLLRKAVKTSSWAPLRALVRATRGTEHERAVWELLAWRARRG